MQCYQGIHLIHGNLLQAIDRTTLISVFSNDRIIGIQRKLIITILKIGQGQVTLYDLCIIILFKDIFINIYRLTKNFPGFEGISNSDKTICISVAAFKSSM